MRVYIKVYRWIFPKMPSEVFYECCKDLELFEKLCKEDIMDERFTILSSYLGLYTVFDNENYEPLAHWEITELMNNLVKENKELQEFKDNVFNLIDKTIEDETQIAENIESTIEGDYVKAVNRLTIIAFKNLKMELS